MIWYWGINDETVSEELDGRGCEEARMEALWESRTAGCMPTAAGLVTPISTSGIVVARGLWAVIATDATLLVEGKLEV